eukprot:ANDGO_08476.mRNA.1 hypothetical protein
MKQTLSKHAKLFIIIGSLAALVLIIGAALTVYFVYPRDVKIEEKSTESTDFVASLDLSGIRVSGTVTSTYTVDNPNYFSVVLRNLTVRLWHESSNPDTSPPLKQLVRTHDEFRRRSTTDYVLVFNFDEDVTDDQVTDIFNDCLASSRTVIRVIATGTGQYLGFDRDVRLDEKQPFACSAEDFFSNPFMTPSNDDVA